MTTPAVSVIMSVYNGERHLAEAVESILDQTFEAFEFIIVDDASTDRTSEILRQYSEKDNRITILTNETNKERSVSRNRAIARATSDLVAVMDADDVSLPDRLEKQVAFMRANPEITVCGGALSLYAAPTEVWTPPEEYEAIRVMLLFESCIYHPTVIYRKEQILTYAGGYDVSMPLAEDYALWARLAMHAGARFANLPAILCRYRTYGNREKYEERLRDAANFARKKLLHGIGLSPTEKEFSAHLNVSLCSQGLSLSELWACKKWLSKLHAAACNSEPAYAPETLKYELQCRWAALCADNIAASAFGFVYFCSEFAEFSWRQILGFSKKVLKKAFHMMRSRRV